MGNKLIRGSLIIFAGNIIFRIGGYVYRLLMAMLLGPTMYGVLGLTLPFQGIFQTLAAGGLPPAIAKYVAEYNAVNEYDMARQTIYTALSIMVFLGLFLGVLMIFVVAPWLAYGYLNKPLALVPLQIVGLITPFSVVLGAFRGAFQGVYKMEYILYTRAILSVHYGVLSSVMHWQLFLQFTFSRFTCLNIFPNLVLILSLQENNS